MHIHTYLQDVVPALLIEDIISVSHVCFDEFLGLLNHLLGHHWALEPSLEDVLQPKEHCVRKPAEKRKRTPRKYFTTMPYLISWYLDPIHQTQD